MGAWTQRRGVSLALPLSVAAIILGILGMHAFNLPGVGMPHSSAMGGGHATTSVHAHGVGEHTTAAAGALQAGTGTEAGRASEEGLQSMLMLCVGMLVAGSIMVPLLRAMGRVTSTQLAFLEPVERFINPSVLTFARAGPPSLWEYSVIRC